MQLCLPPSAGSGSASMKPLIVDASLITESWFCSHLSVAFVPLNIQEAIAPKLPNRYCLLCFERSQVPLRRAAERVLRSNCPPASAGSAPASKNPLIGATFLITASRFCAQSSYIFILLNAPSKKLLSLRVVVVAGVGVCGGEGGEW